MVRSDGVGGEYYEISVSRKGIAGLNYMTGRAVEVAGNGNN